MTLLSGTSWYGKGRTPDVARWYNSDLDLKDVARIVGSVAGADVVLHCDAETAPTQQPQPPQESSPLGPESQSGLA